MHAVRIKFDSFDTFVLDNLNKEIELSIQLVPGVVKANNETIQKISRYFTVKRRTVYCTIQ